MTLDIGHHDRSTESNNGIREVLPYQRMAEIARAKRVEYANALPYPHIVIDGFFDDWILDTILEDPRALVKKSGIGTTYQRRSNFKRSTSDLYHCLHGSFSTH